MRPMLVAAAALIILLPVLILGLLDYAQGEPGAGDSILIGVIGLPLAVWLFITVRRKGR